MKRGGRLKRCRLKPRRTAVVHDPAYRAWIATHPCVVLGCPRPAQCCHVRGKRMWGDAGNCFPGCEQHHIHELHQHGIKSFEARYGLDLAALARGYEAAYTEEMAA